MDMIITGGTVLTMDPQGRRAEALAVRDGKIAAVGFATEIGAMAGPSTRVVSLNGRTLTPGFIDPHNHFSMTTFEPVSVDCRMPPLDGIQGVVDAIAAAAAGAPPGQWIWGLGFDPSTWGEKRRITRWELDEAAPDNPVCIMDFSYHATYTNTAALKLAGIDRNTPDPYRGMIVRDDHGEPEGTLWERAMNPVHRMTMRAHIEQYGEDAVAGLVHRNAMRHLSNGITSVGDALVMPESAAMYRLADARGKLPIMMHQMRGGDHFYDAPEKASKGGFPDDNVSDRLRGGIMKIFMDPVYPDYAKIKHHHDGHTEQVGARNYDQAEADALVLDAHSRGLQVAIHCIGEWAIDQGLNSFERALKEHPASDPRFRIEHLTFPSRAQIKRAAAMGIIVSQQPTFLHTIGDLLKDVVTDMAIDAPLLPLRTMLDEGVSLAAGSDFPCSPLSPILGLGTMVARSMQGDGHTIDAEEAVSPMEALRMYTMGSAYAMFRDGEVGSIEVGKRADMVVLSHDPTAVTPEFIKDIRVQQTYVDGKLLYEGI
jgi:predicted amidohydrolase YtcJ